MLIGGLLSGYLFLDTKRAMSDRLNDLSDKADKMSDIVLSVQNDLLATKEGVFQRDAQMRVSTGNDILFRVEQAG